MLDEVGSPPGEPLAPLVRLAEGQLALAEGDADTARACLEAVRDVPSSHVRLARRGLEARLA